MEVMGVWLRSDMNTRPWQLWRSLSTSCLLVFQGLTFLDFFPLPSQERQVPASTARVTWPQTGLMTGCRHTTVGWQWLRFTKIFTDATVMMVHVTLTGRTDAQGFFPASARTAGLSSDIAASLCFQYMEQTPPGDRPCSLRIHTHSHKGQVLKVILCLDCFCQLILDHTDTHEERGKAECLYLFYWQCDVNDADTGIEP